MVDCVILKLSPHIPLQVEQDFVLMFGEDVSGKFLEKWPTTFKKKIIQQCRKLPSTSELKELLLAADPSEDGDEVDVDYGEMFVGIHSFKLESASKMLTGTIYLRKLQKVFGLTMRIFRVEERLVVILKCHLLSIL